MGVWAHHMVRIEVTKGLFTYHISDIPSKQVKESELRFCSALRNAGFPSPKARLHKIAITIQSTDHQPDLSLYGSACIIGYLCATQQIASIGRDSCILGSVNLGGESIHGPTLYAAVRTALEQEIQHIYIPESAAAYVSNFLLPEHFSKPEEQRIYSYTNVSDLVRILSSTTDTLSKKEVRPRMTEVFQEEFSKYIEGGIPETFLNGPLSAANKKALLVSCIGNHSIALYGPPGQGKTAALRHIDILVSPQDSALRATIEVARSKHSHTSETYRLPAIRPPHTANLNDFANEKKYSTMKQASGHTLILDEFIDFKTDVILSLRTLFDAPLSGGLSTLVVASFNPCPCGLYGTDRKCTCSAALRNKYIHKIPDSIWDRFHLYCRTELGTGNEDPLRVSSLAEICTCAVNRKNRLGLSHWQSGRLPGQELTTVLEKTFSSNAKNLIAERTETFLSLRKRSQVIAVARTLADLDASAEAGVGHALEALSLITALPFR